jgi:hypothetical protein
MICTTTTATLSQARRAWATLGHAETFESAAAACPVRHGSAGWAARWAVAAAAELAQLAAARAAKASLDNFIAMSRDHVPQGLIDELQQRVDEHDAGLHADDWRRFGSPGWLCRIDTDAALAAAHAANGLGCLRVEAAKRALMRNYSGPEEGVNPLMAQWRELHRQQEALRHALPPEGSIREHAARWLADPSELNRQYLAVFVAR